MLKSENGSNMFGQTERIIVCRCAHNNVQWRRFWFSAVGNKFVTVRRSLSADELRGVLFFACENRKDWWLRSIPRQVRRV